MIFSFSLSSTNANHLPLLSNSVYISFFTSSAQLPSALSRDLKEVAFKVDYKVEAIAGREFGSVFLGNQNLAKLIVQNGWAKVRDPRQQNQGKVSPYITELLQLQEQAKQEGFGCWSKVPFAAEASIRDLPPLAIGDSGGFDAVGLLAANKGKPMEGSRDGSTSRDDDTAPARKFTGGRR